MTAPPTDKERQLLQSIAADDQQAFHQLVDLHWSRVYYNTVRLVRSSQTAQEITQDIFLKIWKQRARLTEIQNFTAYINVAGRNQVISAMRKKLAKADSLSDDLMEADELMEEKPAPDQQLQYKETHRLVMSGVACLPPQQQLTFTMSRMEGLSHEEIARTLGLSKNTVKGHIVLALNFLRTYLRQHLSALIPFLFFIRIFLRK
jgi:RNA polymerase sigma-19 factor, ECF subfamily